MDIIKASGEKEKFSKKKLYQSLKRIGAQHSLAEKVSKEITKKVSPGISSGKILNQVTSRLKKESPVLAARYSLKKAIMEMGPTGFPFERYVAEILRQYDYNTKVGKIVKGYCVDHEIDVVAEKEKKHFMIECKYHNSRGNYSDIKVALYTYARFLDVKSAWEQVPDHKYFFHQVWLVTNTRCTNEAIRYAKCVGLKIISWRYPRNESLEYLIEKKGLYPITVLLSLTKDAKEKLAEKRLVLAKDLLKYSINNLAKITGLKLNIIEKLQEEAKKL